VEALVELLKADVLRSQPIFFIEEVPGAFIGLMQPFGIDVRDSLFDEVLPLHDDCSDVPGFQDCLHSFQILDMAYLRLESYDSGLSRRIVVQCFHSFQLPSGRDTQDEPGHDLEQFLHDSRLFVGTDQIS